jgi:hypothetical protein
LSPCDVGEVRYFLGGTTGSLYGKPEPQRASIQFGAVLEDHGHVVSEHLDRGWTARADGESATAGHADYAFSAGRATMHNDIIHRGVPLLLKAH